MSFNSLPLQNNQYGSFNYLLNGNFDRLDAYAAQVTGPQNWNAYKDAAATTPVDGTGGSPTIINNAIVSSGTLRGIRSMTITKTGNAQGEGYSTDFTIDAADKSKALTISFDCSAGSAYTAGDLAIFIYDITNSTLITPSVSAIPQASGLFQAQFGSTTSSSYRLIVHCAASNATTTNWSMELDNIRVSNSPLLAANAISDWQSFTPSYAGLGSATLSGNVGWYRRVGDTMEVLVKATFNANGSGAVTVAMTIPNSQALNTGIIDELNTRWELGTLYREHASSIAPGEVFAATSTTLRFLAGSSTSTMTGADITSGDSWAFKAWLPIANWAGAANFVMNQTEYAFNTSSNTAAGGVDTTSFGYGPQGTPIIAFASNANNDTEFTVRFKNAIQPSDFVVLEVQLPTSTAWVPASESWPFTIVNAARYGVRLIQGTVNTDVIVSWGNSGKTASGVASYGGNNGDVWSTATSFNWRVRKSSGPTAIQLSGNILGNSTSSVQLAGYVGEVISATNSTGVSPSSGVITNLTNIVLTPGSWIVTGCVTFSGSTISQMQGIISTANNTQSGQLYDGSVTTISLVSGSIASTSLPVGPQIWRVAAGTTQTLYLNVQVATSGSPVAKGSISATRFM